VLEYFQSLLFPQLGSGFLDPKAFDAEFVLSSASATAHFKFIPVCYVRDRESENLCIMVRYMNLGIKKNDFFDLIN